MEELLKALRTISNECSERFDKPNGCQQCPMGSDEGVCHLMEDLCPCNWKIVEPQIIVRVME